jgi:hypothetical protein
VFLFWNIELLMYTLVVRGALVSILGADMGDFRDTLLYILHHLLVPFECT